jgi:hypothetical protein
MEDHAAARPNVGCQPAKDFRRIRLKLQHIAADQSVERPVERHLQEVSRQEGDVVERSGLRLDLGGLDRSGRPVDADNLASVADQLGGQEGDVTCAGADVEHPHAGGDPAIGQKSPGDRVNELSLGGQPAQLPVIVAEHVGAASHRRAVLIHLTALPTATDPTQITPDGGPKIRCSGPGRQRQSEGVSREQSCRLPWSRLLLTPAATLDMK